MTTKIMYLMDYYIDPRGGTERQVLHLIQSVDKSRYEPSITLLHGSEYIGRNGFPCQVIILGISKIASIRSIFKLLRFGFALRQQDYRIVHCFFNDVSLIAPPLFRMFGVRVLVSRRDMGFWYTPRILAMLRFVSQFVDCYVVNSQAVKRVVQEQENVARKKILVINNGYIPTVQVNSAAAEVNERLGAAADGPIIGIVANLRKIKRIDTLVEAFGAIHTRFPNVCLVIVGDCQSKQAKTVFEELERLANHLGVRNKVVFIGSVSDPMSYVNRFTVAVLCSESEGFSNALIEYMQAGRPIICTDTGGNPELIQDGTNGFLVPVGDVHMLADCLVKLLSDKELAQRFGEAAQETVRSNYSLTRMIAEQMNCYDEVLSDY
jgi:glycosyltransferase involved in cell wall biosynthesis